MKTQMTSAEPLQLVDEQIDWVLSHPDMSDWLKDVLRTARECEPITLLNDLELVQLLLQSRSRALIERRVAAPNDYDSGPLRPTCSTRNG